MKTALSYRVTGDGNRTDKGATEKFMVPESRKDDRAEEQHSMHSSDLSEIDGLTIVVSSEKLAEMKKWKDAPPQLDALSVEIAAEMPDDW